MDKAVMWDILRDLGICEETLRVVTNINGYSEEIMEEILFSEFGYRSFEQLEEEWQNEI